MKPLFALSAVAAAAAVAVPTLHFSTSAWYAAPVEFLLLIAFSVVMFAVAASGKRALALCASAGALMLLVPMGAYAQTAAPAASTTISLAPIVDGLGGFVSSIAGLLIAAVLGWLTTKINSWLGLSLDASHRDAVHSARMTAVNAGIAKIDGALDTKSLDVGSPVIASAVSYVLQAVPDAVKYFGLDAASLEQMALAKLQSLLGVAPPPATATA